MENLDPEATVVAAFVVKCIPKLVSSMGVTSAIHEAAICDIVNVNMQQPGYNPIY
jgi:hypothetical protein